MGNSKSRSRMVEDFPSDKIIDVVEISGGVLGREITERCGNEGNHANLKKSEETTLRFLRNAITVRAEAIEDGADLTNAAFIFMLPGREFVIRAGDGDWEYFFSDDDRNEVSGQCVRKGRKKPSQQDGWIGFRLFQNLFCSSREASATTTKEKTGVLALTES